MQDRAQYNASQDNIILNTNKLYALCLSHMLYEPLLAAGKHTHTLLKQIHLNFHDFPIKPKT